MSQLIGVLLLVITISAGLYLASNQGNIFDFKFESPIRPRLYLPSPSKFLPVPKSVPAPVPSLTVPLPSPTPPSSVSGGGAVIANPKPVRISWVRPGSPYSGLTEVALSANLSENEQVNITGWTVQAKGGSFFIPQAQEVYSSTGIEGDIFLKSGHRVSFYSGRGLKGNFRLNKCMGYLEDASPFNPSLPRNCPYISRFQTGDFSGACQDYIASLWSCQNPAANPPVPLTDFRCHDFLRTLNYVGCVDRYRRDADFPSSEWRIWLDNQINIFDPLHDKVKLIDLYGKVADEYIY